MRKGSLMMAAGLLMAAALPNTASAGDAFYRNGWDGGGYAVAGRYPAPPPWTNIYDNPSYYGYGRTTVAGTGYYDSPYGYSTYSDYGAVDTAGYGRCGYYYDCASGPAHYPVYDAVPEARVRVFSQTVVADSVGAGCEYGTGGCAQGYGYGYGGAVGYGAYGGAVGYGGYGGGYYGEPCGGLYGGGCGARTVQYGAGYGHGGLYMQHRLPPGHKAPRWRRVGSQSAIVDRQSGHILQVAD
jgi:hypothetical protein